VEAENNRETRTKRQQEGNSPGTKKQKEKKKRMIDRGGGKSKKLREGRDGQQRNRREKIKGEAIPMTIERNPKREGIPRKTRNSMRGGSEDLIQKKVQK